MWSDAKEKALKYIENLAKIKELTPADIILLSKDQKQDKLSAEKGKILV